MPSRSIYTIACAFLLVATGTFMILPTQAMGKIPEIEDCLEACKALCDKIYDKCMDDCRGDSNPRVCRERCMNEYKQCLRDCEKKCKGK